MKINNLTDSLRAERVVSTTAGQAQQASAPAPSTSTGSKVELSDLASRLNQLETQFPGGDFDAKKVEAIRTAMAEGRFQISSEAVADKLLASVDELLGRKS